jgi:hypothetical protein
VFPVNYEPNLYILFIRGSVFNGLIKRRNEYTLARHHMVYQYCSFSYKVSFSPKFRREVEIITRPGE